MTINFDTKNVSRPVLRFLCLLSVATYVTPLSTKPNPLQQLTSFFNPSAFSAPLSTATSSNPKGDPALENELLALLSPSPNKEIDRLSNSDTIASLVSRLEATPSIPRPAISPSVYGRWRLLTTTDAGTASPIQRKAVDSSQFAIYQDILRPKEDEGTGSLIVSQVVKFGEDKELVVDALASTSAYPLEELTAREGTGKVLGLNVLGVSLVGEEALPNPDRPDSRIDFVFDEGNFIFGKFKIPYPVPFRLPILRDTVKGWIDITYLSDRVRISQGNKGTTFVLVKEEN